MRRFKAATTMTMVMTIKGVNQTLLRILFICLVCFCGECNGGGRQQRKRPQSRTVFRPQLSASASLIRRLVRGTITTAHNRERYKTNAYHRELLVPYEMFDPEGWGWIENMDDLGSIAKKEWSRWMRLDRTTKMCLPELGRGEGLSFSFNILKCTHTAVLARASILTRIIQEAIAYGLEVREEQVQMQVMTQGPPEHIVVSAHVQYNATTYGYVSLQTDLVKHSVHLQGYLRPAAASPAIERLNSYVVAALGALPFDTLWSLAAIGGNVSTTHADVYDDLDTIMSFQMHKLCVLSHQSNFQRIAILDVPFGAYRGLTSGAVNAVGKALYMGGALQVSEVDEHIYHEALIHPGMLLHPNPKRVVIVGGGDGAAVREVLRHKSVEHVTLAELDPTIIGLAEHYLHTLHKGAFGHRKFRLQFGDGYKYIESLPDGSLDVLYMDVLDPDLSVDAATKNLSDPFFNRAFYRVAARVLDAKNGVLVFNTGSTISDSCVHCSIIAQLQFFFPFVSLYHTYVSSFQGPWSFVIATHSQQYAWLLASEETHGRRLAFVDKELPLRLETTATRLSRVGLPRQYTPILPDRSIFRDKPLRSYDGYQHTLMFQLPQDLHFDLQQNGVQPHNMVYT